MALVNYYEDPKITDTVLIQFQTTDENGLPFTPYQVDKVTIFFLERSRSEGNTKVFEETDPDTGETVDYSYTRANPIKSYGTEGEPAWLSIDTSLATITKVDYDNDGNPLFGTFKVEWKPEHGREGDYFVCWTWTPIVAGTKLSNYLRFFLAGDTQVTTAIPTHFTIPGKYEELLDVYVPEMFKNAIAEEDVTADVINRLHQAMAKGFSNMEDSVNQIVDLHDANAVHESLLPYLSNLFSLKLKSQAPSLWRRQIKRAIPLYKKKGSLPGLEEAFEQAQIKLTSITQYWQVVSPSTWQEAFNVSEGQTEFELAKVAMTVDPLNFELSVLFDGDSAYIPFTSDYVTFTTTDGVTTMTWVGESQSPAVEIGEGDIIKVLYKVAAVADQTVEDYIRTLPLLDLRDESEVCYPLKNWNVRGIAEDDPMFDTLVATRHPFHESVIFGKVRTEFPYSENIYNMEEYNGSTRDSTNPCDIDLYYLDDCKACLSSSVALDVECTPLTNDRINEAKEIARDYMPFHAVIHSLNFSGGFDEFMLPPVEEVTNYVQVEYEENVIQGNITFNRSIQPDIVNMKRNMLATATSVATRTDALGQNLTCTLYFPEQNFDQNTMGLDLSNNYLEILSGLNMGTYTVSNPSGSLIDINESPTLAFPFEKAPFPFRLSNKLFEGTGSIFQDDLFLFTDATVSFGQYNIVGALSGPAWKIQITSGPHAGSYTINEVKPDNSLSILSWPTNVTVSNLNWELKTNTNLVITTGIRGQVKTERRGRVETSFDLYDQYGIRPNHYVYRNDVPYKISGMLTDSNYYIEGWTGGNVGGANLKYYKRVIDNGVGYIYVRGMKLTTAVNHYTALGVSNALEDDNHVENFMILIGTDYYQIEAWSGTQITIKGTPLKEWGIAGTGAIAYSIIKFAKTSPVTIGGTTITRIDRRGNEVIESVTETSSPMFMGMTATFLNSANSGQPIELIGQQENITFQIEWLDEPPSQE